MPYETLRFIHAARLSVEHPLSDTGTIARIDSRDGTIRTSSGGAINVSRTQIPSAGRRRSRSGASRKSRLVTYQVAARWRYRVVPAHPHGIHCNCNGVNPGMWFPGDARGACTNGPERTISCITSSPASPASSVTTRHRRYLLAATPWSASITLMIIMIPRSNARA